MITRCTDNNSHHKSRKRQTRDSLLNVSLEEEEEDCREEIKAEKHQEAPTQSHLDDDGDDNPKKPETKRIKQSEESLLFASTSQILTSGTCYALISSFAAKRDLEVCGEDGVGVDVVDAALKSWSGTKVKQETSFD